MERRSFVAAFSAAAVARPGVRAGADPLEAADGGVYDVSRFGAKGDGATDDRAAIQAAVAAAQAAGGGIVYVPPGTYLCSYGGTFDTAGMGLGPQPYSVAINRTGNLSFRGAGRGVSILKKSSAGGTHPADFSLFAAVVTDSCPRISFEDLTFDGGQTTSNTPFSSGATHLILAIHLDYLSVNRCDFQNSRGGGIYVWRGRDARIEQCHFTRLDIDDLNNAITLLGSPAGAEPRYGGHVVRDCSFVNNGQIGIGVGGYQGAGPLTDVLVSGCVFQADTRLVPAAQAMELNSVADSAPLQRVTVENCHVYGGCGFSVQGSDITVRGCIFNNMDRSQPEGYGNALRMSNAPATSRITFENLVVDTTRDVGIWLGGAEGGQGQFRLINVAVYNAGKEGIKETDHAHGNWNNREALEGAQFIACRAVNCGCDGIQIHSGAVSLLECVATGNGRTAPGLYSGLSIQGGAQGVSVMGGRYGSTGEAQQKYGIDDAGRLTRITNAETAGKVGPVNHTAAP